MIALDLPQPLMWALRWALFLGPLSAVMPLVWLRRGDPWMATGALFAFLYGLGLIFVTHMIAINLGWWRYGDDALMLQGLPVDIWFGGAILFGPVLFLLFPLASPFLLPVPIVVGLHGTLFLSLKPLVIAGPAWPLGVLFVFAVAHLPAIYLAQWTWQRTRLPFRVTLLALGYGCLAFIVIPSLILHSTGGTWDLERIQLWRFAAGVSLCTPFVVIGLSAVQFFALYGSGTAIPLDPTKHLVRSGLFAYVVNPMQLCTAAIWVIMGATIGNVWIAAASIMVWVFVVGMVRWHHRHDLLRRFPYGWPQYRLHVGEWLPRWSPWFASPAVLNYDPGSSNDATFVATIQGKVVGLRICALPHSRLEYCEPSEAGVVSHDAAARWMARSHINLAWAVLAAAVLLFVVPVQSIRNAEPRIAGL